jgi:hypothetical protein
MTLWRKSGPKPVWRRPGPAEGDDFRLRHCNLGHTLSCHTRSCEDYRDLEHVPEKWTRFSDKNMPQIQKAARVLIDQAVPPDKRYWNKRMMSL